MVFPDNLKLSKNSPTDQEWSFFSLKGFLPINNAFVKSIVRDSICHHLISNNLLRSSQYEFLNLVQVIFVNMILFMGSSINNPAVTPLSLPIVILPTPSVKSYKCISSKMSAYSIRGNSLSWLRFFWIVEI